MYVIAVRFKRGPRLLQRRLKHIHLKFVIIDGWEHAEKLQEKLDGLPISIKYCPTNPSVSLLIDLYDSRFDGKSATQNPYWYAKARERDSFLALDLNEK
jgi:hypothetical protein